MAVLTNVTYPHWPDVRCARRMLNVTQAVANSSGLLAFKTCLEVRGFVTRLDVMANEAKPSRWLVACGLGQGSWIRTLKP